jgi:uncharacterized membrane protein
LADRETKTTTGKEGDTAMATIEESVEVEVPVRTAYNQWTQFEEFPRFMEGVEQVRQMTDTKLHWVAEIAGQHREWDAEITEQVPDQRISWCSTDGATNSGVVTFHRLGDSKSKVMLQLEFEPEGVMEKAGDKLGMIKGRTKADLKRFKEFIESQGRESGAWRGDVPQGKKN